MAKKQTSKSLTPLQQQKKETFQKKLHELCSSPTEERYLTQAKLAEKFGMSQSDVSRVLKGYDIDWETGDLISKEDTTDLLKIFEKTTITKPSVFFLSVPPFKRQKVKQTLLKHFASTPTQVGIIHIIETTTISGLLLFSDDHNLEYNLGSMTYLKEVFNKTIDKENSIDSEVAEEEL